MSWFLFVFRHTQLPIKRNRWFHFSLYSRIKTLIWRLTWCYNNLVNIHKMCPRMHFNPGQCEHIDQLSIEERNGLDQGIVSCLRSPIFFEILLERLNQREERAGICSLRCPVLPGVSPPALRMKGGATSQTLTNFRQIGKPFLFYGIRASFDDYSSIVIQGNKCSPFESLSSICTKWLWGRLNAHSGSIIRPMCVWLTHNNLQLS